MISREARRLFERRVGYIHTLGADYDMGAGYFLRMEPHIALCGGFQRELIVLHIVSADQNFESVCRPVLHRSARLLQTFFILDALSLYISGRRKLGADLVYLAEARSAAKRVGDSIYILKLRLALFNERCEHLLRRLCFAVFFVILLRVCARRECRIGIYAAGLVFVIIVRHFVERHALAERVLIRSYQFGIYPQFIFIGTGGKLGALIVESAAYSRSCVAQKLLKIGRALARAVYSVALAVEFIEKLRKAVIALGGIRRAVLVYLFKREIERLAGFVLEHSRFAGI